MSVKIRLSRGGAKKRPYYYVVVAHGSSPRDGRYIEQIGTFDPMLKKDDPNRVKLNDDRVKHWLGVGRAADRPRPPSARRRGPRQADAVQQPREGKAEEEGPGTRRSRCRKGRQGCRSHCRASSLSNCATPARSKPLECDSGGFLLPVSLARDFGAITVPPIFMN